MKTFFSKIAKFISLVLIGQLLIAVLIQPPIPDNLVQLETALNDQTDLVYFGDSTVMWTAAEDVSKATTAEMLQSLLPEYTLVALVHQAYHTGVYEAYAQYIHDYPTHPRIVVIIVNLRSFSPSWDVRPEYQFADEILASRYPLLHAVFGKPLAIFQDNSRESYLNTPVYNGTEKVGQVRDFDNESYLTYSDENLRRKFIFDYMYGLSASHRKVAALATTVQLLTEAQIHTIVYITPVDYISGEQTLGPQFSQRLRENVSVIEAALTDQDAVVLDLSTSLGADTFDWRVALYPNEHLNESGRTFVAQQLATAIEKFDR